MASPATRAIVGLISETTDGREGGAMYGTRNIYRLATEHQTDERRQAAAVRVAAAAAAAASTRPAIGTSTAAVRRPWLRWPVHRSHRLGEVSRA